MADVYGTRSPRKHRSMKKIGDSATIFAAAHSIKNASNPLPFTVVADTFQLSWLS